MCVNPPIVQLELNCLPLQALNTDLEDEGTTVLQLQGGAGMMAMWGFAVNSPRSN